MGGRVENKPKKKGIKANVTSKFGSKRKLSRMGKKVQKGKAGANTEFITRSAALRRLQITLKDFRRLCILKGIYPRVPSKTPSGGDKIYYDIKDISYIMHEPLLEKFREFKSFMKKIRRAAGRNQFNDARRKNDLKPKITLDHLVKERYPRFIDALRDMDDALCMIHLFAALPSIGRVTSERTSNCAKLAREWQYYVSKSRGLKKVFVSVKGVYYQAEIMGEPITWLVPHPFTQAFPKEVDFRVMLTFLEFYEIFVKFTLYKLYHLQGMQYPPVVDKQLEAEGCCLLAMKTESINQTPAIEDAKALRDAERAASELKASSKVDPKLAAQLSTLSEKLKDMEEEDDEDDEDVDITAPLSAVFSDLQNLDEENDELEKHTFTNENDQQNAIFSKLVFFINREVPLDWIQFCTTAFGGKVGWDGALSPIKIDDPKITHHIIDRPLQGNAKLNREYVQPQWVFDCINAKLLLPTRLYAPAAKLPPHLSPFVDDEKEGYMPRYKEEISKLQKEAGVITEGSKADESQKSKAKATAPEDEEEDFSRKVKEEKKGKKSNTKAKQPESESEESEDEDVNSSDEEKEELDDLPAVAASHKGPKAIVYKNKEKVQDEETEIKELSKQMMGKKTKRLYDRMQHGIGKKKEAVEVLESKRKAIEEQEQPASKTPSKRAKKN